MTVSPIVRSIGAIVLLSLGLAASGMGVGVGHAIGVPPNFVVENAVPGGSFDTPVGMAFLPDGRMLVAEKRGRVYAVKNGVKHPTPLWSEESRVASDGDRGLLGIAVDPDFAINRYIYLLYTVDPDSNDFEPGPAYGRLVRYQVSVADSNVLEPASRTVLMGSDWSNGPPVTNITHSVGSVRFGSDRSLLISVGDGAGFTNGDDGGDTPEMFGPGLADPDEDIGAYRALYLGSLSGKILRINPDDGTGYSSNPFYNGDPTSKRSKVWASGLRNPYRFTVKPGTGSLDPGLGNPGTLYIGDVGWRTWEEMNIAKQGGMNFGWPCYEGFLQTPEYQSLNPPHTGCDSFGTPDNPSLPTDPISTYHHDTAGLSTPAGLRGISVIGGAFYQGTLYPSQYQDRYFFADFGRNWIKVMLTDENDELVTVLDFADDAEGPVDITADPVTGDLYYISIYANEIRRIRYQSGGANLPPIADAVGTPSAGLAPLVVSFSSAGSYDPNGDPLTLSWMFGDGSESSLANPDHTYSIPGTYNAVLTVDDGLGGIARDSVIIVAVDQAFGFPTTPVLDDFDRPNGPLASPWVGNISGFLVDTNTLMLGAFNAWGVWNAQVFGPIQEAYITLSQLTPNSPEHNLMLKLQGQSWADGCIEVRYDDNFDHIAVGTYTPGPGWQTYGTVPATLQAGDQLGARVYPDGLVQLYVNGVLLQAVSVSGWPYAANGGRLGLTVVDASLSRLDDFGGGNYTPPANTPPQATLLTPLDGTFFAAGDTIWMTGAASDGETQASELQHRWQVDLHHNIHTHPSVFVSNAETAFYETDDHDDGTGVWYRILYIVTDGGGLSDTSSADIHPEVDLEPTMVMVVPDPPNNVEPAHYKFAIRNHGRMPAPISRWRLVAGGSILAEGDTVVAAGDSLLMDVTVAAQLVPGDYSLRITLDTLASVIETDETNNGATRDLLVIPAGVSVEGGNGSLALSNAYPNPASGPVRLGLQLPQAKTVDFAILDLQGRLVWRGKPQRLAPGRHDLEWPGRTNAGQPARPGLYLARVAVDGQTMTRRIAVLK